MYGSNDIKLNPTFIWETTAFSSTYRLQLANDSLFTSPIIIDTTLADTSYTTIDSLETNSTYYWHVKAMINDCGSESEWSNIWNFQTITETRKKEIKK